VALRGRAAWGWLPALTLALVAAACGPGPSPTGTPDGAAVTVTGTFVEQGPDYVVVGAERIRLDGRTRFLTPPIVDTEVRVVGRRGADGVLTALSLEVIGPAGATAGAEPER
jgi:hypothetical protein